MKTDTYLGIFDCDYFRKTADQPYLCAVSVLHIDV